VKKFNLLFLGIIFLVFLTACSGEETSTSEEESKPDDKAVENVKLVLNWFPKAQHGGVYAAQEDGTFEEHGLNVTIEPGGPQVSSVQMIASGSAEFGLAHADQLVIAKNQGIDLVAVAAAMQGSPQVFMFHKGHGIKDFTDLNGRKVYVQPGITYWDFLKSKYDLSKVEELAYNGQHTNFVNEKDSVTQAFATSEPFFLEKEGIETETKLIADAGYDPYNVVLFVTKEYLEKNEETVQNFVTSFVEGWNSYKTSSESINKVIQNDNPDIALDALAFETESQEEFVYGKDASEHGVGYMTEERWTTLIQQLHDLDLLEKPFEANEIFTTKYLPEK